MPLANAAWQVPSQAGTLDVSTVPPALFGGEFLYWAVVLFLLAIVAAAVGARGVAGISMEIARIFVVIFLVLAVIALVL